MATNLKLGLVTPVLSRTPIATKTSPWQAEAGIQEVARIAEEAERLGYYHMNCCEHVGVPQAITAVRGGTYWDPLATFGFLAARTRTIRFSTMVLVLAYHHPLAIVKRYGTLDRVSGGRLIIGVGVGSLKEEFDLLGAQFEDRGARGDDAIRALRAAWGRAVPKYHGPHYQFDDFVIDPVAVRTEVPIWIGGRSARSLRRAVELGDGWAPFGLGASQLTKFISDARNTDAWAARKTPLELALEPDSPLDPLGQRAAASAAVERYREIGTTLLNLRFESRSLEHYCEQLAAMRELVPPG